MGGEREKAINEVHGSWGGISINHRLPRILCSTQNSDMMTTKTEHVQAAEE